jgi:FeS assembly SUF system protein|tara:strand:- start:100 stop:402 length:303 start_codon:yes stop_codon:yes gene_type:complete
MSNLKEQIITKVKTIFDPEIPVNIYDLGLIYKIDVVDDGNVNVEMTLTSPNCPVAESLPRSVKKNILQVEGVKEVDLKLVWDPPWNKEMITEAAKLELGI